MRSVELFAGIGGLALGAARAGFEHDAVVEWSTAACETLRRNKELRLDPISSWNIFEEDVRFFDYERIDSGVDLVAGGPPCQPFSLGGKHKGQEDRRDMFPAAVCAIKELRPRAFIFENVRGLLRKSFSEYFEYIILRLTYPDIHRRTNESWRDHQDRLEQHHSSAGKESLTYQVLYRILDAADYGVPQRRHRVFIVGFRRDTGAKWSFPQRTHSEELLLYNQWITGEYWDRHEVATRERPSIPKSKKHQIARLKSEPIIPFQKPWLTVRDALQDLPDPELDSPDMVRASVEERGITAHDYNPGARVYPGHTGSPLDEPAKALKAGDHGVPGGENMLRRPDGSVRYFTVRESARLQTFPDAFQFDGSWTTCMRGLGNAVPVDLGHIVSRSVADSLRSQTTAD